MCIYVCNTQSCGKGGTRLEPPCSPGFEMIITHANSTDFVWHNASVKWF